MNDANQSNGPGQFTFRELSTVEAIRLMRHALRTIDGPHADMLDEREIAEVIVARALRRARRAVESGHVSLVELRNGDAVLRGYRVQGATEVVWLLTEGAA